MNIALDHFVKITKHVYCSNVNIFYKVKETALKIAGYLLNWLYSKRIAIMNLCTTEIEI